MTWTLLPLSVIYGLIAVYVFRRFTDETLLRDSANRMIAHAMELRLFIDSPRLVFRAQRELLRENLHLLRLISIPSIILAALFTLMFPQLDAMYGHAPLRIGEDSVVTAHISDGQLEAPTGIRIESPAVRSIHDRDVSWQIRPLGAVSGQLRVQTLTQPVVAGKGLVNGWRLPFTSPSIEIPYPKASVFGLNWMVWFFLFSTVAALVYAR
jgi:hypothetical protein